MMSTAVNRRSFLRGAVTSAPAEKPPLRPPGVSETSLAACNACGECAAACPEDIIVFGADGYPKLSFAQSGCDFCGTCVEACKRDVFATPTPTHFEATLSLSDKCLIQSGVACQICTDFCDHDALLFDLSVRPAGAIQVDNARCTGCGFCVGSCPAGAITVQASRQRITA